MSTQSHRVAVVQAAPQAFELDATLQRMSTLLDQARAQGATLALFPEAYIGGYPKGADFGARVGSRTDEGREAFARYHQAAIDLPGPTLDRLCQMAGESGLDLVTGVIERDAGTLYCTVVFISAQGQYLGKHRKLMPTAMERLIWGFGDGSTLPVLDMSPGRVGAAICWENYMPMLRMSLYQQGLEIWCAPTVDDRDSWIPSMRHIAVEGRCYVLSACQYATRTDFPEDQHHLPDDPAAVLIRGGSCIVDPFGEVLAGPVYGQTDVLVADLDPERIAQGRYDLDVTGHYARPDVFQLRVDRRQKPAVRFDDSEDAHAD